MKSGWISGNEQSHKTVIDSQQKVFVERMRYVVGQHDVWRIGVLTEMDHPKSVGDRSHIAKQGFEYIMQKRHAVEMNQKHSSLITFSPKRQSISGLSGDECF